MLNVDSSVVCKCASDAQKRDEVIGLRDARSTRVHWDLASFTPLLFESFKPSTAHLHPNIGREPAPARARGLRYLFTGIPDPV